MANQLDSLQSGYSRSVIDATSQNSNTEDQRVGFPNSDLDQTNIVLHWSPEQVRNWFRQCVSFESNRLQEYLQIFQKEGVDGSFLLTVNRNHRACFGMTDFEWLLFKEARKRLLDENAEVISEHFGTPPSTTEIENTFFASSRVSRPLRSPGALWPRRGSEKAGSFWKLFSIPRIHWGSDISKDEQIELLVAEVESLRGEITSVEERETNLQAHLEHLDEILRSARLAGYLYTRTRWTTLPGEPPIDDDTDVDDWVQRFVVLRGSCIFFYLRSTDISPQDSILLEEIVESGPMPTNTHQDGDQCWFTFYITSRHGLRLECSTPFKQQLLNCTWQKSSYSISWKEKRSTLNKKWTKKILIAHARSIEAPKIVDLEIQQEQVVVKIQVRQSMVETIFDGGSQKN